MPSQSQLTSRISHMLLGGALESPIQFHHAMIVLIKTQGIKKWVKIQ